jgi:alpha-amylase
MFTRLRLAVVASLAVACASAQPHAPAVDVTAPPGDAADAGGAVDAGPGRAQPTPAWLPNAVIYEIFARSFADSNGDGTGDLDGITAHLDYLSSLGVNAVWLTPIHPTPSDHGYDVTDYDHVAPDLGGDAALDRLLTAVHGRGMKLLLDGVFNHTSNKHPWFLDAQKADSKLRDRYVWQAAQPDGWSKPWGGPVWYALNGGFYYGLFSDRMPDLNYRSADTQAAIIAVTLGWLARGVDGFRLDAARYLAENGPQAVADQPETQAFWKSLRASASSRYPQAALVGEVWVDNTTELTYAGMGDELNAAFDFDLSSAFIQSINNQDPGPLKGALDRLANAPAGFLAPFLTNHDQDRFASQVNGDEPSMFLGPKLLLALPGPVVIYYGEELGLKNGLQAGDARKRTPMQWTAGPNAGFSAGTPYRAPNSDAATVNVQTESTTSGSLLSTYQQLVAARQSSEVLRVGTLRMLDVPAPLLAFARGSDEHAVVCVFNLSATQTKHATITWPGKPPTDALIDLAHPDRPAPSLSNGVLNLDVGSRGGSWLTAR